MREDRDWNLKTQEEGPAEWSRQKPFMTWWRVTAPFNSLQPGLSMQYPCSELVSCHQGLLAPAVLLARTRLGA